MKDRITPIAEEIAKLIRLMPERGDGVLADLMDILEDNHSDADELADWIERKAGLHIKVDPEWAKVSAEWVNAARYCQQHPDQLLFENDEPDFIDNMVRILPRRPPSKAQAKWLKDIYRRIKRKVAACAEAL